MVSHKARRMTSISVRTCVPFQLKALPARASLQGMRERCAKTGPHHNKQPFISLPAVLVRMRVHRYDAAAANYRIVAAAIL